MMMSLGGQSLERPVFSPAFYRELALENPLGLTLHWREVEAWFNYIAWPAYKTYGYRRHKQAVRRWWSRCSMRDLDRARAAMENHKIEMAQESQDALPLPDGEAVSPDHVPALRKIMGGRGGSE